MFNNLSKGSNGLKTILLLEEEAFRKIGDHGDVLIGLLREKEEWIKDGVLTVFTNIKFSSSMPLLQVFNDQLRRMRSNNIISIKVKLEQ